MVYGYLRVSSDRQDVASQRIGVEKKANELGVDIDDWIKDEGISGAKEYSKRNLGDLLKNAKKDDIIIVSEISRLARSVFMLFRIVEYCMENEIIIYSVKDSINTIKKGDITGIMMVFCFGIAAQIEREMIIKRTVEGLERRRRDGVIFGRPVGSKGKCKLDGKEDLIKQYFDAGVLLSQLAKLLKVGKETLRKFCIENNIAYSVNTQYNNTRYFVNNQYIKNGAVQEKSFNEEKNYIISLIDIGLTDKYIVEKLIEKGYNVSVNSFSHWKKKDKEFYKYYIKKHKEHRAIKNKDCGSNKQYYKF